MTSHELVPSTNEAKSLDIGATVARALVLFLQRLQQKLRYIIAKGVITLSDMANRLRMKHVLVVRKARR